MVQPKKEKIMDWIKTHTDTVIVLGALLSTVLWMNCQFNSIDNKFSQVEKELAIIKTVLVMKNIMPSDMACKEVEKR